MNRRVLLASLAALALAVRPLARRVDAAEPTGPQPALPKQKITIITSDGKRHVFDVEMATTEKEQETGLMFRKSVPADGGMLFVWSQPQDSSMWMKNTLVPLDMVFINADGTINAIAENTVPHSLRPISSHGPVAATLELAGGTTAKLGIVVGDKVEGPMFSGRG